MEITQLTPALPDSTIKSIEQQAKKLGYKIKKDSSLQIIDRDDYVVFRAFFFTKLEKWIGKLDVNFAKQVNFNA